MTLLVPVCAAWAADIPDIDAGDQQLLERALYLCQWKTTHDVPDSAPIPAVCRSGAVSTDAALLQDKQWWTFWVRLNSDAAMKANQQFSADFAGFHARLQVKPELAEQLLPPDIKLPRDDWRIRLIRALAQRDGRPVTPNG